MSDNAFNSLSVGSSFNDARFAADRTKFKKGAGDAAKTKTAPVVAPVSAIPMKSPLSFFGGDASGQNPSAQEADATPAKEHSPIEPMTRKKMTNLWKKHKLQVKGSDIPSPIEHLSSLVRPPLSVPEAVVKNLFDREHKVPTPVQMQAIPALIHRRDTIACAPTGSGKTVAFVAPIFALLKAPNPKAGVRALVIAPTMELAMQIEREVFLLMKGDRWKLVQHGQTTKNKDIFIGTPNRVASMVKQGHIDLAAVEYIAFDEGDKLWDKRSSYLEDIDSILAACTNTKKVTSVFTATLSEHVESVIRSVMSTDVIRIIVADRQQANTDVDQRLVFVGNEIGKVIEMKNLIREGLTPPVLVFVQSIERTKELHEEIRCAGLHCAVMNSKMSSEERDNVVLNFRLGKIWVLITTELLARGVDFKGIGTVINFDFPTTAASYIHRIGRTGRAGRKGTAITFFTEDDKDRLPDIARIVKKAGCDVPEWMLDMEVSKKRKRTLKTTTPHRLAVSTRKRMLIGEKRIDRQLRAAERERGKKRGDDDDEIEDDGSDIGGDFSDESD